MPTNRLFNIPGSHPAMAAQLMLNRKGVDYKRVDLLPILSKGVVRAAGFPGTTVPALKINGEKVQGTRKIAEALDRLYPDDPIIPSDPERLASVDEIDAWADEELQGLARRMLWAAMKRDGRAIGSFAEGAKIGIPIAVAERTAAPIIYAAARSNKASDDQVRGDLAALPEMLSRVKGLVDSGKLDASAPTLADYQVATSLKLMMSLDDVRPAIEAAGLAEYINGVVPVYPGQVGPVFPAEWLKPLN